MSSQQLLNSPPATERYISGRNLSTPYSRTAEYSYGPKGYPGTWPTFCSSGKFQSPIDLRNAVVTRKKPVVSYVNYDVSGIVRVINDGHTIKILGFRWGSYRPYVMHNIDGAFKFYRLKHVQFHWGPKDLLGSEHTFAGFHMPLEIQFVHERVKTPDGPVLTDDVLMIAVLGTTIVERNSRISTFGGITAVLPVLTQPGTEVVRRLGSLLDMIPDDTHSFYYYHGSRTVPNCEENAAWIVLDNAIYVSRSQMMMLRNIHLLSPDVGYNFRPTMPLNGRKLLKFLS